MVRFARKLKVRAKALALVLRRVPVGEADLLVTVWGRDEGLLALAAAGARRAKSKLGALEPLHTLEIVYETGEGAAVGKLVSAELVRPRLGITESLEHLEAASTLLGWIRGAFSERSPEPSLFARVELALDRFALPSTSPGDELVRAGFFMLRELGYGLDFDRCVSCGKACPPDRAATLDPSRGGLVCAACGGGPMLVRADERVALSELARDVADRPAPPVAMRVLERALASHGLVRAPSDPRDPRSR